MNSFIVSTVLSHVLTYPFMTVIRNMQCNEPNKAMMQNREERMVECCRRIYN